MAETNFTAVYNCFLNKITDDMYLELTPGDTLRDLQHLLLDSIPGFEFPRKNLNNFELKTEIVKASDVKPDDFVIGPVWREIDFIDEDNDGIIDDDGEGDVIVEKSKFLIELSAEEINILALLMK